MSAAETDAHNAQNEHHVYPTKTKKTPFAIIFNMIRGGLIGMAELVPGISGGTVALVLGLYERALHNGDLLIDLIKVVFKDRSKVKEAAAKIDWWFLGSIAAGMVVIVFSMSSVLHTVVEDYPEITRALFLGMVAVSILVPLGMMDMRDAKKRLAIVIPLFIGCAVVGFFGTSFTSAPRTDPSLLLIFVCAAIAVCALVLPGVSGSFFLLAVGLYAPIMESLSNRDWPVIGVFILGALTGIILFVKALSYVLEHHRTITLTIMAGLMLGSLRALWPWQDADANLMAPGDNAVLIFGIVILGGAIVALLMFVERTTSKNIDSEIVSEEAPR
ncbi:hypothetical protein CDES_06515 [Corynebacterium deserti GIMN1.010]|uniref:DUF368 domain-containing protein n=1 Tax=Corynebacterium deserti GIMN1.010 TaxID=931089 RepID=A0A0M3Q9J8_9CORY|nr:DUF368 domain-containing protein [Corynebacterium deserti]ALC05723.1 hypothetical protein CDES_06515 [Corynebacterium deserti GIMN1.010]